MSEQNHHIYEFGPFRLDAQKRRLLRGGEPVKLFPKDFDTLLALVEHSGEVIDKDVLIKRLWGDTIVEDGNLATYVSHLRKALGEKPGEHEYIVTVPGKGYRFVAGVRQSFDELLVHERTRAELTVEEVEEADEIGNLAESEAPPALSNGNSQNRLGATTQVFAVPALTTDQKAPPLKRTRVALLTALFGLLLLAGGSWAVSLYQSRNRDEKRQAAGAPLPAHQITMRRFTTTGGLPRSVAISPDGKSLVYMQLIDGKYSLWLGQIETNSSVPISQKPYYYQYLAFAPEGDRIYATVRDDDRSEVMLVRMSILGGAVTELIPNVHSPVTFSPDGKQLAFLRRDDETRQTAIIVADAADGKRERALVTRKWPEIFSSYGLSWSPDGKTIAAGTNKAGGQNEILAVSVADGTVSKIGNSDWGSVANLVWLPDGSHLAIIAREKNASRFHLIWLVSYPEGEARKLTNILDGYLEGSLSLSADGKLVALQGSTNPSIWVAPNGDARQARRVLQGIVTRDEGRYGLAWTPDGRLLYSAYVGDSQAIWEMNGDGGNQRQLTPHSANTFDNQVSVTTDGRYMVFHSNRSGDSEIWRSNTDGSDLKQLTAGGGNSQPCLSPDGQWVVYASARDGQSSLWRISIDGGEATQLTDKSSSWPEVSPDGKYVAYANPSDLPRERLAVIQFEGGEPVKSFAIPQTLLLLRRMRWTPDGKAIVYFGIQGLWRQALDEEKPQQLKGFEDLRVFLFAWSFDGKDFAYTTGTSTQEIVLIENFK